MNKRITVRGELALATTVLINSMGVLLMLKSGSGISAISSVPYAFSLVLPRLSLGTWTYIFQSLMILSLMVLRRRFVPEYLFSFVVGFLFGKAVDMHSAWIDLLPVSLPLRFVYFAAGYVIISFGIAISNRCKLPIIPTDLFPRELSDIIGKPYSVIKIAYDVICLSITGFMTFFFLGRIMGLGIGTVLAAFTTGKAVALIGSALDRHVDFVSCLSEHRRKVSEAKV